MFFGFFGSKCHPEPSYVTQVLVGAKVLPAFLHPRLPPAANLSAGQRRLGKLSAMTLVLGGPGVQSECPSLTCRMTHCRRTGVERRRVGLAVPQSQSPWVVAAPEGPGGDCEAVLGDFVTMSWLVAWPACVPWAFLASCFFLEKLPVLRLLLPPGCACCIFSDVMMSLSEQPSFSTPRPCLLSLHRPDLWGLLHVQLGLSGEAAHPTRQLCPPPPRAPSCCDRASVQCSPRGVTFMYRVQIFYGCVSIILVSKSMKCGSFM